MALDRRTLLCGAALGAAETLLASPGSADNAPVTVRVDAAVGRRAISPPIYGLNLATAAQLKDLNCPLNRQGGNHTSRYNWRENATNRAADWYFQSIGEASATPGQMGDSFIAACRNAEAQAMLTLPMLDWVARLGPSRAKTCSFSVSKYGPQQDADWQWYPDAGNGVRTNGSFVTGNDPNDAHVAAGPEFQQAWVRHLVGKWGNAAAGGLRYYVLDNEHSIWHATHRDVHPTGARMEEVRDKMVAYAQRVKAVDPGALVVGPEEWGWSGYFWSGYDQQYGAQHGWSSFPDREAHGGAEYLPWLLAELRQASTRAKRRLLDIFTVHFYPQGGEFSNDVSQSMQLRRNRSTRALWDPNYVDQTWINDRVQLVRRLRSWVNAHYPGTKIGITEYSWGADGHINGATAQADILGIFGREGLDMAARWTTPAANTPTYKAIKLYRNYDGRKSAFGETKVSAAVPDPDTLSAFGALRTRDGGLTIMLVSKYLANRTPVTVRLANFAHAGRAQVWQLTSANAIRRLTDLTFSGTQLTVSLPPQSVTLLVLPAG